LVLLCLTLLLLRLAVADEIRHSVHVLQLPATASVQPP
jgi:hypothetical protein